MEFMKLKLFLLSLHFTQFAIAQDVIIMNTGDEIEAKVTKVGNIEIEYKKWSNLDGPIYTVGKNDVFMIKYINGDKEVFNGSNQTKSHKEWNEEKTSQTLVRKIPASNNIELISMHNSPVKFTKTPKEKDAHYFFPIMAMSDSSLISTDELEMRIVPTIVCNQDGGDSYELKHSIELTNKTDKIIYIDLANCFRVYTDGTSKNYFESEQTTVNHGSSSGVGFNLGGITGALGIGGAAGILANSTTVGGGSQHGVSTTYSNQRILAIPPHTKKDLTEFKQVHIKKDQYKTISDLEEYGFFLKSLRGKLKQNSYIEYTESETPYTAKYYILYSTSQDFSKYSILNAHLYARYVVGGFYSTLFSYKREKTIKDIQKYISNFWTEPGIIIGQSNYIPKK